MASRAIVLHLGRAARRRVERLGRKTQDKTTFRRCQIVLRVVKGERRQDIAGALSCHVSTVSRTVSSFREQGEGALRRRASPGRPRKLTAEQVKRLDETTAQEPREMGKNQSNWSSKALVKHLNLPVHPTTVQRYLKRLGWRWGLMRCGCFWLGRSPGGGRGSPGGGLEAPGGGRGRLAAGFERLRRA